MKKYDLGIVFAGLLFGGVVYFVASVMVGLFVVDVNVMAATKLAVLGWVLVVLAVVVNSWSSVDSFKQY